MANAAVRHQGRTSSTRARCPPATVRSLFLSAGQEMAGSPLPAIVNLVDAEGAGSPGRAAASAEDLRSGSTR